MGLTQKQKNVSGCELPISASDQASLLMRGRLLNKSLEECLCSVGMSVDDLRYAVHPHPPEAMKKNIMRVGKSRFCDIPAVSFFSGAGGMDIGLEMSGFKHVALFESNKTFCKTMRLNRPHWPVVGPPSDSGDVSKVGEVIEMLENKFSLRGKFPGIFSGGPPCQPFSVAANQRFKKHMDGFKRIGYANTTDGLLLYDFGKIIKHFMPRVFLIENVPGLLDMDGGARLSAFCADMSRSGYRVDEPKKLRAEMFGVPQYRNRLFIVGNRDGKAWIPPAPWEFDIPCGSVLNRDVDHFENHQTRAHKIESVLRYRVLDFGKRDHLGRVDRLNPFLPSKTVIAGGVLGGGRSHLHPWIPRTLSVRESARLQSFPDEYVFTGPIARQFTQVGNAVPPLLAKQLGDSIRASFYNEDKAKQNSSPNRRKIYA